MALGGKVEHRTGPVLRQQTGHQGGVGYITLHKSVAHVALQRGKVGQIAGIGELVQVNHRLTAASQPVQYKVAADKTGAAGDKNGHGNVGVA